MDKAKIDNFFDMLSIHITKYNASVAALAEMTRQRDAALLVIEAARSVHNGASVATRRAALERLGVALDVYDKTVGVL
jgi:hypothetical protein